MVELLHSVPVQCRTDARCNKYVRIRKAGAISHCCHSRKGRRPAGPACHCYWGPLTAPASMLAAAASRCAKPLSRRHTLEGKSRGLNPRFEAPPRALKSRHAGSKGVRRAGAHAHAATAAAAVCRLVLARPEAGEGDDQALDVHRAGGDAVADVGADVVAGGVGQVGGQVGQGALAGGLGLQAEGSTRVGSVELASRGRLNRAVGSAAGYCIATCAELVASR